MKYINEMLEILKLFNYSPPTIKPISSDEIVQIGPNNFVNKFEVRSKKELLYLMINGRQWMLYNIETHQQAAQLFSHYYLACGDVITTGLGFATRENWILKNPKIKSLTVIEKNQTVIDYHRKINPKLFKKANIICADASEYKGKCDTLLLDHYEGESMKHIFNDIKNIRKNIEFKTLWFWPLEVQLIADTHGVEIKRLFSDFIKGFFQYDMSKLKYLKEAYENIKLREGLIELPTLSDSELKLFITIYTMFFQKV